MIAVAVVAGWSGEIQFLVQRFSVNACHVFRELVGGNLVGLHIVRDRHDSGRRFPPRAMDAPENSYLSPRAHHDDRGN